TAWRRPRLSPGLRPPERPVRLAARDEPDAEHAEGHTDGSPASHPVRDAPEPERADDEPRRRRPPLSEEARGTGVPLAAPLERRHRLRALVHVEPALDPTHAAHPPHARDERPHLGREHGPVA